MPSTSIWKGSRGEWYLVVQAGLFLLLAFGPRTCCCITLWDGSYALITSGAGLLLFVAGALFAGAALANLGKNLTPLPCPKENAQLITDGAYRVVRHPIYSGILFMAFGWGLWLHSWLVIGYTLLLFIFFEIKSRYEERLLIAKFQEYAEYCKRVRKLIPFLY